MRPDAVSAIASGAIFVAVVGESAGGYLTAAAAIVALLLLAVGMASSRITPSSFVTI